MDALVARLMLAEDTEIAIRDDMAAAIAAARRNGSMSRARVDRLKVLLVGYAGAGNIGADIRVIETARQLQTIIGREQLELGLVTRSAATMMIDGVKPETLGEYFPLAMAKLVERYDMVVVCEGSLFTSAFSNTLTAMLTGALAMAAAQGKPAIAYGVEAGRMDEDLADFVRAQCRDATIFCRSLESVAVVEGYLGMTATLGSDTAWTFVPAPSATARAALIELGWNGVAPVLALCPINPFWWPVRPDIIRAMTDDDLAHRYDSTLFHHSSADVDAAFERYIGAVASAATMYIATTGAFAVIIGMERLDNAACQALANSMAGDPPVLIGADLGACQIVALLREATLVVTSRFHAAVTAMPNGVSTIGVAMDERLRNLFTALGRPDLCLAVDDPDLAASLFRTMKVADRDIESIAVDTRRFAAEQLVMQSRMGRTLAMVLEERFPGILSVTGKEDLARFLPELSLEQQALFDAGVGKADV